MLKRLFKRLKGIFGSSANKVNGGAAIIIRQIHVHARSSRRVRRQNWKKYKPVTGLTWAEYQEVEKSGFKLYNNQ